MTDTRFSLAIHILTLLADSPGEFLPSERIAGSMGLHPVLVRKELVHLREKRLILSKEGKGGGSKLAKPAEKILLSDIYKAVREEGPLGLNKHEPNPDCPVGKQIKSHLTSLYEEAEAAMIKSLGKQSLAGFLTLFH
jgi:Rrf2 family protein